LLIEIIYLIRLSIEEDKMKQSLNLKIAGLYTHPNQFSEVPEGALIVADNVVIDRESIADTRRGQKQYGDQLSATGQIDKIMEYKSKLIIHYDTTLAYDSDDAGTWSSYSGSYSDPDTGFKIRSTEQNKNFYFSTSAGVKKLDAVTSTPTITGAYKALGGTGAVSGASGFMNYDTQVAYRIVWGYTDVNNNLILGTPSQRIIVNNPAGPATTHDVDLTFDIPSGVTTSWVYQIYRSNESASDSTVPDDELQLVYEDNPTSGEITAKEVTITDSTQNELKGAALYTNQSEESILKTNDQPPFCKDIVSFKNHVFYANTKTKHRYTLNLISVGATDGVQVNDTITIGGVTYTGKAAEDVLNDEFLVYTAGTPSQNIDTTALSLIKVINQSSSNTLVYAYYLSGFEDIPGAILIEERGIAGSSFALTSSRSTCWNPRLPSSGTDESSDNEVRENRIYVSKPQQPEAVPLLNYIDLGSADKPIRRMLALRDSVMVFKDDGIYRITGTSFPFTVTPFNSSIKLKGNETAVVLDNRIYCMTDQGVVAIHDSGTEIISHWIETTLVKLLAEQYTNFSNTAFGVAYESDRKYILYTVTETTDTYCTQAWVYNTITKTWTKWTTPRSAGLVKSTDDKLYTVHPTSDYTYQERKTFDRTDYADEEYAITITGSSGTNLEVADSTNIVVGSTIVQGDLEGKVTAVVDSTNVTMNDEYAWTAAAATTYTPIGAVVSWVPQHGGNLGIMKHWAEATFIFDDASFTEITATFSSNIVENSQVILVPSFTRGSWGSFTWGGDVWGGSASGSVIIRTFFPRATQRSHWMNIKVELNQAYSSFSVAGISVMFNDVSSRIR